MTFPFGVHMSYAECQPILSLMSGTDTAYIMSSFVESHALASDHSFGDGYDVLPPQHEGAAGRDGEPGVDLQGTRQRPAPTLLVECPE